MAWSTLVKVSVLAFFAAPCVVGQEKATYDFELGTRNTWLTLIGDGGGQISGVTIELFGEDGEKVKLYDMRYRDSNGSLPQIEFGIVGGVFKKEAGYEMDMFRIDQSDYRPMMQRSIRLTMTLPVGVSVKKYPMAVPKAAAPSFVIADDTPRCCFRLGSKAGIMTLYAADADGSAGDAATFRAFQDSDIRLVMFGGVAYAVNSGNVAIGAHLRYDIGTHSWQVVGGIETKWNAGNLEGPGRGTFSKKAPFVAYDLNN